MRRTTLFVTLAICSCLTYAGYWFGSYRTLKVFEAYYLNDAIERELAEARHDEIVLRTFSNKNYDAAGRIMMERYFSRMLLIAGTYEKTDPIHQQLAKEKIAQAMKLKEELLYRFPADEDNKLWTRLTK